MIATCERGFYSWGAANGGCLATNTAGAQVPPVGGLAYIPIGMPIIMIACGRRHVIMIIQTAKRSDTTYIEAVKRGEIADTSGCSVQHSLYGWGHIAGLGLKYHYPRMSFEPTYYDLPQQIPIDDPDCVACGDDYSLILAHGVVYLCQDTEVQSEGGGRYNGLGPRKLGFSEVTKMFACCGSYVIRTARSCEHVQGAISIDDSSGQIAHFVELEDVGYVDCYEAVYRFSSMRSTHIWPPSACFVEDMLYVIPNVGKRICASGNRKAILLLTTEDIYLVCEDGHMRLCAW
jgi:hypothetical protein